MTAPIREEVLEGLRGLTTFEDEFFDDGEGEIIRRAIAYLEGPSSTAWPPRDVLVRLCDAADHLLGDHDCDHHGYEEVCAARDAGRRWLADEGDHRAFREAVSE